MIENGVTCCLSYEMKLNSYKFLSSVTVFLLLCYVMSAQQVLYVSSWFPVIFRLIIRCGIWYPCLT